MSIGKISQFFQSFDRPAETGGRLKGYSTESASPRSTPESTGASKNQSPTGDAVKVSLRSGKSLLQQLDSESDTYQKKVDLIKSQIQSGSYKQPNTEQLAKVVTQELFAFGLEEQTK